LSNKKNDIRCISCGKKLAEAEIKDGFVNIQCKCGVANLITASPEKKERERAAPEKREYPRGAPHY
jgi:phage FluMu protein Com